MTCPSCGSDVPGDRDFCPNCGAYLRWEESPDEEQTAVLTANPPTRPTAEPVAPAQPPAPAEPATAAPVAERAEEIVVSLRLPGSDASATEEVETSVDAGGQSLLTALVRNQSGIVDRYELVLEGLPRDWWTITPATLHLVPFGSEQGDPEAEATVVLHPPRTPEAEARAWPVRLVARSQAREPLEGGADAVVRIAPFELFESRLHPARVRAGGTADYALAVRNRGNAPLRLAVRGEDEDGEVRFAFDPPNPELAPGGEARIDVRVSAPRPLTGSERQRRLTVYATGERSELTGAASFVQRPRVTPGRLTLWRVLLTLAAAALLVAASFLDWAPGETGLCVDGADTCLRYDTYVDEHLGGDAPAPGDLGDFTRLFNFATSLGVVTLIAGAAALLGILTGRLAWFAGVLALAVLIVFAVTADAGPEIGVWLGFLGALLALVAGALGVAARRAAS